MKSPTTDFVSISVVVGGRPAFAANTDLPMQVVEGDRVHGIAVIHRGIT